MAFCPNCGNQIDVGGAFCGACGTPVAAPAAPAAPVEPAAPAWAAPIESDPTEAWTAPVAPAPAAPAWSAPETPAYSAPAAPTYTTPTYTAPAWNSPTQKAELSGSDKAKGIVGMALGIGGMVLAIIGLLYVLIFMGFGDGFSFGMAIGFGIFTLPLSIIGRNLAGKSQDAGNTSGVCSAGKTMGLVGVILSALMFFFGFISLMF